MVSRQMRRWLAVGLVVVLTAPSGLAVATASQSTAQVHTGEIVVTGAFPVDPILFLWLPGSMGWPNLRGEIDRQPPSTSSTVETVDLSNRHLTARFVPRIGFRLYDLTWNDEAPSREGFLNYKPITTHMLYGWEGMGYYMHFGSMKWGFPYYGHTTADHQPWDVAHGVLPNGDAWAKGTYTDIDTQMVGTVRAVLPADEAVLRYDFSIHNPTAYRQAYDFWIDGIIPVNDFIEFAMPAPEAVTHQNSWGLNRQMFMDWPFYLGRDLRFFREWKASQGVFPWGQTDNFTAFYDHSRQTGAVRVFPLDKVQGVKFWMPGKGWGFLGEMFGGVDLTQDERRYLEPGQTFSWTETWYPIRDLHGVDAANEHLAMRVANGTDACRVYLTPTRAITDATVTVWAQPLDGSARTMLAQTTVTMQPCKPITLKLDALDLAALDHIEVGVAGGDIQATWSIPAKHIKNEFDDPGLTQARKAYLETLTTKATAKTPSAETDQPNKRTHDTPKPGYLFKHAGKIGSDGKQRLAMPAAACVLADGQVAVLDVDGIRLFAPDLTYLRSIATQVIRGPIGLAGQGKTLYVADSGDAQIVCIDLTTGDTRRKIKLPGRPGGITLWQDGLAVVLPRQNRLVYLPLNEASDSPVDLVDPNVLRNPFGVTADGDRLIVADTGNRRVVSIDTTRTSTVLADSSNGLETPSRVAVLAGKVYVLDVGRCQVLKLDKPDQPAAVTVNGRLFGPVSLGLGADLVPTPAGSLLTLNADPANLAVVAPNGSVTAKYANHSYGFPLSQPRFSSFCRRPNGDWLVTGDRYRIYWFDPDRKLINEYGAWGRNDGQLWQANKVICDSRGYVYVSDFFNFRVMRFDPNLRQLDCLGQQGLRTDGVPAPGMWYVRGLAVDSKDRLYVATTASQQVAIYSPGPENKLLATLKPYAKFHPIDVSIDSAGNLFILDNAATTILKYSADAIDAMLATAQPGTPADNPQVEHVTWTFEPGRGARDLVGDGKGGCYVTFPEPPKMVDGIPLGAIAHVTADGKTDRTFRCNNLNQPRDLAIDGDELLVADSSREFNSGIIAISLAAIAGTDDILASRQVIASPTPATSDDEISDAAGFMRIGGANGNYMIYTEKGSKRVRIDPATMKIVATEPANVSMHWTSPSPDGTQILHKWKRAEEFLCSPVDGSITTITFAGCENPDSIVRDHQGRWWVSTYNKDGEEPRIMLFGPDGPNGGKPLWSIPFGAPHPIGDAWHFAPRRDGKAWVLDPKNAGLHLLSDTDGAIVGKTANGVLNRPTRLWILDDQSLLVGDRNWGILHLSPDGQTSTIAIENQPAGECGDLFYDRFTDRLFYSVWRAGAQQIGWANRIAPAKQ